MIITKKGLVLSSMALFGAFGTASAVCPEGQPCTELDIIVRDFPSTHPDFENFSEEATTTYSNGSWVYHGYSDDPTWVAKRQNNVEWACGNEKNKGAGIAVGQNGYPMGVNTSLPPYLQTKTGDVEVHYGESFGCRGRSSVRGYVHEYPDCKFTGQGANGHYNWNQVVYVTPGMVQTYLQFDPLKGEDMMYEPIISPARNACDNQFFDHWYRDDNEYAKRTNTTLQLPLVDANAKLYEVDYNWNNGGYFPLDVVDANNNWIGSLEGSNQYGPQSLSIFCPPYNYEYADAQTDYAGDGTYSLCQSWLANGGPKVAEAAKAAAGASPIGLRHLRNYSLTMMGYAKFKYKKGNNEVFEFAGDDDMWIFIDGVLAVDLGGTHLAAPGKADMDFLAANAHGCHEGEPLAADCVLDPNDGGWADGSWHHLHFFYADRQTDGSNMRIRTTLSEVAPSRYGAPTIGEATITPENGVWSTNLILNVGLSDATIQAIKAILVPGLDSSDPNVVAAAGAAGAAQAANGSPVIVRRAVVDPITGEPTGQYETYTYVLSSFGGGTENADGFVYTMTGALFKVNPDGSIDPTPVQIQSGDELSFNYPAGSDVDTYIPGVTDSPWIMANPITGTNGLSTANPSFGGAQVKASIGDNFDVVDNTIARPPFNEQLVANGGEELSETQTGELQIVILPPEAGKDPLGVDGWLSANGGANQKLYGSTKVQGQTGVFSVNNTKTGSPVCYSDARGIESCASISFWVDRPFKVNVRVFDHLGHFISQYTQTVTEEQLSAYIAQNNAAQGVTSQSSVCASKPVFSGALVTTNMYPMSQNGRKIATGPYIYQVALVKQPWTVPENGVAFCFRYAGNDAVVGEEAYERSQFSKTLGYRRTK